ncbi:hypothetical protein INR49_003604 [Caranx melampygus]|nr:hypothetical protein INR49_003604 [Caranx melampygus]
MRKKINHTLVSFGSTGGTTELHSQSPPGSSLGLRCSGVVGARAGGGLRRSDITVLSQTSHNIHVFQLHDTDDEVVPEEVTSSSQVAVRLLEEVPGVTEEVPGVVEEVPGVTEEVPGVVEEVPGVTEEVPGVVLGLLEEVPGDIEEVPGVTEEVPGVTEEVPGDIEEVPGVTEEVPGVTEEVPGVTEEVPGVTEEAPVSLDISDTSLAGVTPAGPPPPWVGPDWLDLH